MEADTTYASKGRGTIQSGSGGQDGTITIITPGSGWPSSINGKTIENNKWNLVNAPANSNGAEGECTLATTVDARGTTVATFTYAGE